MPHTRIFPIVLAIGLVLLLQPVFGQKRKVDVRALWGYTARGWRTLLLMPGWVVDP